MDSDAPDHVRDLSRGADDAELVRRAQDDPAAFGPLYDRYNVAIYRYCDRRLGNREAAEDATSVTFTRAFTNLPRFHEGSFRGWLFSIAHNVIVDEYRSRKPQTTIDAAFDLSDPTPLPDQLVVDAEAATEFRTLLDHLSTDQRRVIELRLADMTQAEIVQALDRDRASVYSLTYRAVNHLRQLIQARSGLPQGEEVRYERP